MTRVSKKEKSRKKLEKIKMKQRIKQRQRINKRIERTVSFLAILVCVVFSVMEQKGNRKNG